MVILGSFSNNILLIKSSLSSLLIEMIYASASDLFSLFCYTKFYTNFSQNSH